MMSFFSLAVLGMVMGMEYSSAFLAPNNNNNNINNLVRSQQVHQPMRDCSRLSARSNEETDIPSRRDMLKYGISVAGLSYVAALPQISNAASTTYKTFKDEKLNFQFQVPESWTESKQTLPDRREIIVFADESSTPVMFLAYTPIRDDFTSLGSFGSVDQVASMTILPKGGKGSLMDGEEEIKSKMISAVSKTNQYIFDYTMKTEALPEMHYRALWTLAAKAGYAGTNLVTLTLQTEETKYEGLKQAFDEVITSFGKLS